MRRADRWDRGFTLVEVLVAFTVAALLLGVLYQVFSTGLRSASAAADYSTAVLLAESALETVGTQETLAPGQMRERVDRKYDRRVVVRPRPDLLPAYAVNPAVIPYEVQVTVDWQNGRRPRSVSLTTLRLGAPR